MGEKAQKKGRFSKLAAVSRFAEETPELPKFDRVKADRFMRCAVSLVSAVYPTGALEWIEANRPDVKAVLDQAEAAVDAAVVAEDYGTFFKCLEKWSEAHFRAFSLYNTRPPVINRD